MITVTDVEIESALDIINGAALIEHFHQHILRDMQTDYRASDLVHGPSAALVSRPLSKNDSKVQFDNCTLIGTPISGGHRHPRPRSDRL